MHNTACRKLRNYEKAITILLTAVCNDALLNASGWILQHEQHSCVKGDQGTKLTEVRPNARASDGSQSEMISSKRKFRTLRRDGNQSGAES